jgi:hypothetical protein
VAFSPPEGTAGFTAEGVTRAIGWRDGITYSLLRTDPAP